MHPTPYTPHPEPYTLHPTPCTLRPTPYTLHPTPKTLHPTPHAVNPTPYTLYPTPEILRPTLCTQYRKPTCRQSMADMLRQSHVTRCMFSEQDEYTQSSTFAMSGHLVGVRIILECVFRYR